MQDNLEMIREKIERKSDRNDYKEERKDRFLPIFSGQINSK